MNKQLILLIFSCTALLFGCKKDSPSLTSKQWTSVNTGITPGTTSIVISNDTLYAGGRGGVYRSGDNGASWTAVNAGLQAQSVSTIAAAGKSVVASVVGSDYGYTGIYYFNDTTHTWRNVDLDYTNIAFFCTNGTDIFGINGVNGQYDMLVSHNNGVTWTLFDPPPAAINAIVGNSANLFAGGNDGTYISTDGGKNWSTVNRGVTGIITAMALSGTTIFAAGTGGVFLSTDNSATWKSVSSGLQDYNISTLTISGDHIFAGTYEGTVFVSTDNGTTWIPFNNSFSGEILSVVINGNNIFAAVSGTGVFASTF